MFADRWVKTGIYTTDMLDTSLDHRNITTWDAKTNLTKQHKYKLFVPVVTPDIDPLKPKYTYLGNVLISGTTGIFLYMFYIYIINEFPYL